MERLRKEIKAVKNFFKEKHVECEAILNSMPEKDKTKKTLESFSTKV